MVSLNLTPMVDMMSMLVVFLLQMLSADGDLMLSNKDLVAPEAKEASPLEARGPVVTVDKAGVVFVESDEIVQGAAIPVTDQNIRPVVELLDAIRKRDEEKNGRDLTKPFEGVVILQADEETDFRVVRQVIASVNEAGWSKVNFTVRSLAKPPSAAGEGAPAAE
jgi:biopolymer transport protein ExbD